MDRTINCHAWKRLSEEIPERPAGDAANHGSTLHKCMEAICTGDSVPEDFLGEHFEEWDHTVDDDDVALLQTALEAFDEVCDIYDVDILEIEAFVQLEPDLIGGSADVIICGDDNVLVVDWKFGYTPVSAYQSWQGATYALSAMNEKDYADMFEGKKVVGVIIQPKVGPTASVYEYGDDELATMQNEIIDAVNANETDDFDPTPGAHCTFCPAAPTCPAKLIEAKAALSVPAEVSMDLATAMGLAEQLEPWIKSVKEFAHEMLEAGAKVEGWKLVDKKSSGRVWNDLEEVTKKLKAMRRLKVEDYANIKVKTPPQMEKECKIKKIDFDKEFGAMLHKAPSSGTTLVPASDKRPDAMAISQADVTEALGQL